VASETVHYRTCPFCEATCGLEVTLRDTEVVSVRGDQADVFSHGFLCPKSQGLKQLHDDPDRLTRPLVRRDGELVEASWDEAFAAVDNGSLLTAPDMRGRIRAIRERGGKVVVVDPRLSRTARESSEHHFIRPGTDALLLFAIANTLLDEGLTDPGDVAEHANAAERISELAAPFTPDAVAAHCGIAADEIRRMARELAAAPRAAVYARIGTTTQRFGTLASWLVDVINYLTGNLDREGGAMFPLAAVGQRNSAGTGPTGKGVTTGRWTSRVSGRPEVFGELPVVGLAEEITTPGDGQVRALVTVAGNPVVSTPDAGALEAAVAELDFMVAVDIYVNETTRHADVILPAPEPLAKSHYDFALYQLAVRSVANYSPPALDPAPDQPQEWETMLRLAAIAAGQGPDADLGAWDELVVKTLIGREVAIPGSRLEGRDADQLFAELGDRRGPERVLDFMLRAGPFGDGFGADPDGLTLAKLEAAPHGIDLGPMRPRIPDVLRTPSGKIELAPDEIVADVPRLEAELGGAANGHMVLIGRRQLRSNNSWMHNLPALVKGKDRCTLQVHPDDAERLGLADGGSARVSSTSGELVAPVEITEEIMPGVVSIPHGWGHDVAGVRMSVASEHAGVNSNLLAPVEVDAPSGNAVLNGIEVEVTAADREPAVA
jgi:anaerobic selenocysteine-containing dehydrogenase